MELVCCVNLFRINVCKVENTSLSSVSSRPTYLDLKKQGWTLNELLEQLNTRLSSILFSLSIMQRPKFICVLKASSISGKGEIRPLWRKKKAELEEKK